MNSRFRWLYGSVVALGTCVLALALFKVVQGEMTGAWLSLACLALVAGSFTLKIPGMNGRVSAGDTVICLSLILFGPYFGAATAALDGLAGSLRCKTVSRRVTFALYNSCAMALSAFIGGQAFQALVWRSPLYRHPEVEISSLLLPLGVLAVLYYLANTFLVAGAVALEKSRGFAAVWQEGFQWTCVNYLAGAAVAGMLMQIPNPMTVGVIATALLASAVVYFGSTAHIRLANEVHRLREHIVIASASANRRSVALPLQGMLSFSPGGSSNGSEGDAIQGQDRHKAVTV